MKERSTCVRCGKVIPSYQYWFEDNEGLRHMFEDECVPKDKP